MGGVKTWSGDDSRPLVTPRGPSTLVKIRPTFPPRTDTPVWGRSRRVPVQTVSIWVYSRSARPVTCEVLHPPFRTLWAPGRGVVESGPEWCTGLQVSERYAEKRFLESPVHRTTRSLWISLPFSGVPRQS